MKNRNYIAIALSILLVLGMAACDKDKSFDGPDFFADDFEQVDMASELYEGEGKWSFYQNSDPLNTVAIDTIIKHSGNQSLRFTAVPSLNGASKSDLANNKLAFHEGKTVEISAWFYIEGTQNLDYLFLFDLEESVAIGAGPGLRFALEGEEGNIVVERNKFTESTIRQPEENRVAFPRNEWVHLEIEVLLSRKKGYIKLWQNNTLLIEATDEPTMPRDKLFYIQGTKGIYNSIQVGITANSDQNDCVLYVDDVEISSK